MRRFEGFQKGVNLGGWISQFDRYDKAHFEGFITEEDIRDIADLGFDHVRVPVDYNVLEDEEGNVLEAGFKHLEDCRRWCADRGLNMLIDLHECYGYSFDPLKDMDRRAFFYDKALQARFLDLWREIAAQEAAVASLEEQLAEAAADYEKYAALYEEKTAAEAKLGELMEQWEALAEEAGE